MRIGFTELIIIIIVALIFISPSTLKMIVNKIKDLRNKAEETGIKDEIKEVSASIHEIKNDFTNSTTVKTEEEVVEEEPVDEEPINEVTVTEEANKNSNKKYRKRQVEKVANRTV